MRTSLKSRPSHGNSSARCSTWFWCRWILLLTLTSLAGCGGCFKDEKLTREELEKRAREQLESLEMSELVSLPADSEKKLLTAKPGHWYETQQRFKSNREDLQVVVVNSVTRGKELSKIPKTNFVNKYTRRTSLPKGQTKTIDLQCFVPATGQKADPYALGPPNALRLQTELMSLPLMTPILKTPNIKTANQLDEHTFQMVALGPKALTYSYLSGMDTVYWRGKDLMVEERTRSYYVSLLKPENNKYAFPRSLLTMTAMAVIVWDDVSPDDLSQAQQQAIIDWVHWGGQLVISGPSSWSRLQNSFLSPYLPASQADAAEFTDAEFAAISDTWMTQDVTKQNKPGPITFVGKPVGGLQLKLSEKGQWLPGSGEMVSESQVGRGRIVLTCFPLNEPRILKWHFFSSFFSTGLLRRHPRTIRKTPEEQVLAQFWAKPYQSEEHDPRMHSNLRILTRDLSLSSNISQQLERDEIAGMGGQAFKSIGEGQLNAPSAQGGTKEAMQWGGSGAAWNDVSGLSFEALNALKAAAGIELPSKRTIVYLLAGYLACLVPLNWVVFRMIGRLEFAWIAAPIMALAGVVVVTKVARLDIGFARRTTEIAVLELHGDHPRAHLTQYLALYTSLSDDYRVDFPENDSVALPLGDIGRSMLRANANDTRNLSTNFGRSEGISMEPLTVYSNSTEMVHAEQIVSLEGGLRLGNRSEDGSGPEALKNDTGVDLKGALILRRTEDDAIETAWIGDLIAGEAANLNYKIYQPDELWNKWAEDPVTQPSKPLALESGSEAGELDSLWIGGILKEIVRKTPLMLGQTRLFAYTNDRTSKLVITPKEDQFDGCCLVVAHLTPGVLQEIVPDEKIQSPRAGRAVYSGDEKELDDQLKNLRPGAEDEEESEADDTGSSN